MAEITILTDNPNSWIIPYIEKLETILISKGHYVDHIFGIDGIKIQKDIMFILSCEEIIPKDKLKFHHNNIVVHPSKLPQGKGWSPLAWQVLEGKNEIPITLFEASPKVDSGKIYLTDTIKLNGSELNDEIKQKQWEITLKLILNFIEEFEGEFISGGVEGAEQKGKETFYPKMTRKNNELDPNKTIKEQFNTLRIVDNERYPAFFNLNGQEYTIKIWKK
jgi:methionyl-tRNA formyltransferase